MKHKVLAGALRLLAAVVLCVNANAVCATSCPQLAVGTREHALVAAPVCHAEGGHSGEFCRGKGRTSSAGTLL